VASVFPLDGELFSRWRRFAEMILNSEKIEQ
jgi:hypothetical protein